MLPILLLALSCALAPGDDPPVSTYTSTSGEWSLSVSRPAKDWNGKNELVMTRAGVEAWRAELELGVREALVGDDGSVGGFGYTGEHAPVGNRDDWRLGGVLRVFALSPGGRVLLDGSYPRGKPPYPTSFANPHAKGAFLVSEPARFVVRIDDEDPHRGAEEWWAFDLATGAALFRERPRTKLGLPDTLGPLLDARALPGTPLVLLQWHLVAPQGSSFKVTNVYQLLDPDWKLVWTRDLTSEKTRKPGQDWLALGGRGSTLAQGRFELYPLGAGEPLAFEVHRAGEGWSVSEVAR